MKEDKYKAAGALMTLTKATELDPKIGSLIQTRIEKIKAKEKDQGIER